MKIDFFGKTDRGRVRKSNEDYFIGERVKSGEYLFAVADGMGGHRAGDVASKLGAVTFVKHFKKLRKKKTSTVSSAVNRALDKANLAILDKATNDPRKKGMGTTFSALVISRMKAYMAHVGDSRIYLVRDDAISQLTTDHTFVGKMVEEGRLTEDEAREHPQKNILYMSLGARQAFEPEITKNYDVKEDDIFIMCSDGLNNMVTDETIKEYVQSYEAKEAVEQLIRLANESGGTDNITLMVVHVNKTTEPAKTEPIPIVKEESGPVAFLKNIINPKRPLEEIKK